MNKLYRYIFISLILISFNACGGEKKDLADKVTTPTVEENQTTPTILRKAWSHGNLQVSEENRTLQHKDGTGFFWMADTAWDLYRLEREDISKYMKDRAKKKFTVIQAVAMHAYWSKTGTAQNPLIDRNISNPNEEYWEHIDYIIDEAEKEGMYVALLPVWHEALKQEDINNTNDANTYGMWIANRYKDRPNIIWVIGGDTQADGTRLDNLTGEEEVAIWNALGSSINNIATNHLMTFHPLLRIPSEQLGNPDWLDFNMLQSAREGIKHSIEHVQTALKKGLAVVDGESLYENLAHRAEYNVTGIGEKARRTAFQMRNDAYSQLFVGAFGNTYGHNAVYRFYKGIKTSECDPTADENLSIWICAPNMTWREALSAPGAVQMQYVTELMKSRPIVGRVEDQSLLQGTPHATQGIVATRGDGYGMIYSSQGKDITVVMGKISGSEVKAWWYNPRNGESTEIDEFENVGTHTFDPKGEPTKDPRVGNDWVLVIDDKSKNFGEPGK